MILNGGPVRRLVNSEALEIKKLASYARNITAYFGASLIPMALQLATNPWIAKNMSPTDYAISGYYTSFSSLIAPIIGFYFIQFYIKEYFRSDEHQRKELYAAVGKALIWFSAIVSGLCFVGILFYLKAFNQSSDLPISPYLALMVFSTPLTGLLSLRLAKYRMERATKVYFWLSVTNGVLLVVFNLSAVVFLKWGAFGKLLAPLIGNAFVFFYLLWGDKEIFGVRTSWSRYRNIIIFCFPLALSATLGYFTNGYSTTYLETLNQTQEYGIYIVGISIGGYLSVCGSAVFQTFQPDFFENIAAKKWLRFIKFCLLTIGCLSVMVIVFVILAPWVISLLTAGRYVASTPYAQIMALTTVTSSIYYIVNDYSIAVDRPSLYLYTTIIGSILIIALMPWAVGKFQFFGGLWLTVLSYLAFAVINILLLVMFRPKKAVAA